MAFRQNIAPVEVIIKGTSGRNYFRDIYSSVTDKWYKNLWKEFNALKDVG